MAVIANIIIITSIWMVLIEYDRISMNIRLRMNRETGFNSFPFSLLLEPIFNIPEDKGTTHACYVYFVDLPTYVPKNIRVLL